MPDIDISVGYHNGIQSIYLDGEDVSSAIRTNEGFHGSLPMFRLSEVRTRLVALQQEIASDNPVVMDGRDIGTRVLPDAGLKIFLTASAEEAGSKTISRTSGKRSFGQDLRRTCCRDRGAGDHNDSTREHSPLKKAGRCCCYRYHRQDY